MSRMSRQILTGALIFSFFLTGCGVIQRSNPTPVWTVPPGGPVVLPTATIPAPITATGTALTPQIPITGENVVSLQCQFCVADQTHAMLVFPAFASFDVDASTPVTCLTADVVDGQRIVICRGDQSTTFNLKICAATDNCLEFPVALQPCPLLEAGATPLATYTPFAPIYLTPINTLRAPTKRPSPTQPANTAVPSSTPGSIPLPTNTYPPDLATPTPLPTQPPATTQPTQPPATVQPTSLPPPTIAPTSQSVATNPPATSEPKPTQKPSHTPKPNQNKP
jgi:hypothetical protein